MKNLFNSRPNGLKSILILALGLILNANLAFAQEEKQFNFSVALNSDQFFGFYPTFQGSYGFSDKAQFTFYGIHWGGGTGAGHGG